MQNFVIMSDSSCDLSQEIINKYEIPIVPLYVSFDEKNYLKENKDITVDDFYAKLKSEDAVPKTSLPSIQDYSIVFKEYLDKGFDIICFNLSSELSGSHQSAINASNILKEEYPERIIKIIDSKTVTIAQGLLVLQAIDMKSNGLSIDDISANIERSKNNSFILFTVDNLEFLQKGGRIGKVTALAGSLLNIKPIITIKEGVLEPHSKVRGRKKSLSELLRIFEEQIGEDYDNYDIAVAYADCESDADFMINTLKQKYGTKINCKKTKIGIIIGSHAGPSAIGIGFIKKYNF